MVGKISEADGKAVMNVDSSSQAGNDTLLARINKKKKEQHNEGSAFPAAMNLPLLPDQRVYATATGGGFQVTGRHAEKKRSAIAALSTGSSHQTEQKAHLRGRPILAAAERHAVRNLSHEPVAEIPIMRRMLREPEVMERGEPLPGAREKEAAEGTGSRSAAVSRKITPLLTENIMLKSQQQYAAWPASAVPASINTTSPQTATHHRPRRKADQDEVISLFQGVKATPASVPQQAELFTHNKPPPATRIALQQRITQVHGVDAKTKPGVMELNYQFQRWSGEHSVRVSIPAEVRREGNITLLPSDPRTADMLNRNISQLPGVTPDLLLPQRDQDERDQPQQHQQQEEEQE